MARTDKVCFDRLLPADLRRPHPVRRISVDSAPFRAAFQIAKLWPNGSTIRIGFMNGSAVQIAMVKQFAVQWTQHANLTFQFGALPGAQVRVAFNDDGAWSYIGTDALDIGADEPTLNLGWQDEGVILHEFGHMIGLIHEHQSPVNNPIQWNKPVVNAALSGPPNNWTQTDIDHNMYAKYETTQINGSDFDRDSVMLYSFPASWTTNGFQSDPNDELSAMDQAFSKTVYPRGKGIGGTVDLPVAETIVAGIGEPGEEDLYEITVERIRAGGRVNARSTGLFAPDKGLAVGLRSAAPPADRRIFGNCVVPGSDVDLAFDYGPSAADLIARLHAEGVEQARLTDGSIEISVMPSGYLIREGEWMQAGRFHGGKLDSSLIFKLTSDGRENPDAGFHVTLSAQGDIRYQFWLKAPVLAAAAAAAQAVRWTPPQLDLDQWLRGGTVPRAVRLVFKRQGEGITVAAAGLLGAVSMPPATLERFGRADWKALLESAGADIDSLVESTVWIQPDPLHGVPAEYLQTSRKQLMAAGSHLYRELVKDPWIALLFEHVEKLEDGARITVHSDCGILPWEILCRSPEESQVWGCRFVIESVRLHTGPAATARAGALPKVSMSVDSEIDRGMIGPPFAPAKSHRAFAATLPAGRWELHEDYAPATRPLTATSDATFVYYFCHGSSGPPPALAFAGGRPVHPRDIGLDPVYPNAPLFFLNSCTAGSGSPLSIESFLDRLIEKNAAGVIAPLFKVPPLFAARFGQRMIEEYLKPERNVGEALYDLRRDLWRKGNPLGLLYSLQCPLDTRAPAVLP